jgi:hypothetical protein
MAMKPGIAGYDVFQNGGRHGSVRDMYAVGKRWTNAVAISTPVPKCLDMKRKRCGTGSLGKRRAIIGNAHAAMLRKRMRKRAKTWMGVLYEVWDFEPHTGRETSLAF